MTDIADFTRILNEQPQWRDTVRAVLLGQDLLDLPRLVADFVQATNDRFAQQAAEIADLKTGQSGLQAGQASLGDGQSRLETALAEFMAATNRRFEQLETGQSGLQAGQASLGDGQSRLETALAEFMAATNRRFEQLEAGQIGLRDGQIRLETALAEFMAATNKRLDKLEAGQVGLHDGQIRLETALAEFMAATNRRLDQLEAGQARLEAGHAELKAGQERLEARQTELEAGQARLEAGHAELKAGQERLEARQTELEAGQARLEAGHAELKAGQERLEARQTELEAGQARLEAGHAELKANQTRMQGTIGRLVGAELEREVHANIVSIASRELGLNRVRILQSKIVARGPELQDSIDDAEEQGIISATEGAHLELADIIIRGRRKTDRQECYVVIEVSTAINDRDISRARERSQTLAAIQDAPAIPAVVGGIIAAPQRARADREGVSVIITLRMAPQPESDDHDAASEAAAESW